LSDWFDLSVCLNDGCNIMSFWLILCFRVFDRCNGCLHWQLLVSAWYQQRHPIPSVWFLSHWFPLQCWCHHRYSVHRWFILRIGWTFCSHGSMYGWYLLSSWLDGEGSMPYWLSLCVSFHDRCHDLSCWIILCHCISDCCDWCVYDR
jgi:hypothetical protein